MPYQTAVSESENLRPRTLLGGLWNELFGGDQRRENDYINNLNRQWQLEDWYRAAEYNSPQQMMARYAEAGLNPHLALDRGSQSAMGTGSSTQAAPSSIDAINPLSLVEGYIRIQQGFASLREMDLKNEFLEKSMDGRVNSYTEKNMLTYYRHLSEREKTETMRVTNSYLDQFLRQRRELGDIATSRGYNAMLMDDHQLANYRLGMMDAISELRSYGMSWDDISFCISRADVLSMGGSQGLTEWYLEDRKLDKQEREAAKSEARMSKALSDLGMHEGDPMYQRLLAMRGVGSAGQSAMAVADKVINTAMQIFGSANTAVGNAVRNAYTRRMTQRMEWMPYQPTMNINTGEIFGY